MQMFPSECFPKNHEPECSSANHWKSWRMKSEIISGQTLKVNFFLYYKVRSSKSQTRATPRSSRGQGYYPFSSRSKMLRKSQISDSNRESDSCAKCGRAVKTRVRIPD